jgi:hypothetical protein
MNIARRGFLTGVAAFMATAIAPNTARPETHLERFTRMAATGRIEDQTFYFDGPVTLSNVNNLKVARCRLIWLPETVFPAQTKALFSIENCCNLDFQFSELNAKHVTAKSVEGLCLLSLA